MTEDKNNDLAVSTNRFFGKMCASATHEIKNTLSIINEHAGLLEDLSYAAQNNTPLSPDRIQQISQKIIKQVKRTDRILQNLNQFSHSVDQAFQQIDLEKTIEFILNFSSRIIQMQGISIKLEPSQTVIMITSNLFYLQNIIWKSIEMACDMISGEKLIIISLKELSETIKINFSFDTVDKQTNIPVFCSKEENALMEYLNVHIKQNTETNGFGLYWPIRI